MPSILEFLPMLAAQAAGGQRLHRTPEPSQLTDNVDNVLQYDRVLTTKLAIAYAAGLETIYRALDDAHVGNALDLACGPGHFTLCLARCLGVERVHGVDLSAPMVEIAKRNAKSQGQGTQLENDGKANGGITFSVGNATRLEGCADSSVDLCCFTDAAHHMPDLGVATAVFREMERVARPDGLLMVMDLVRLRTTALTERYINTLAYDYIARGLPQFFEDFRNSMYAAWTADELRQAVPRESRRVWCHLVPRGLPTIQILLGLPAGRAAPFVRPGWKAEEHPLVREWFPHWESEVGPRWARETLNELKMLRWSLRFASQTTLRPAG